MDDSMAGDSPLAPVKEASLHVPILVLGNGVVFAECLSTAVTVTIFGSMSSSHSPHFIP